MKTNHSNVRIKLADKMIAMRERCLIISNNLLLMLKINYVYTTIESSIKVKETWSEQACKQTKYHCFELHNPTEDGKLLSVCLKLIVKSKFYKSSSLINWCLK